MDLFIAYLLGIGTGVVGCILALSLGNSQWPKSKWS